MTIDHPLGPKWPQKTFQICCLHIYVFTYLYLYIYVFINLHPQHCPQRLSFHPKVGGVKEKQEEDETFHLKTHTPLRGDLGYFFLTNMI